MDIKNARKIKGFTQKQLAEAIGVEDTLISKYECGKIKPPAKKLRDISVALDVPTEVLFAEYDYLSDSAINDVPSLSRDALHIASLYDMLPPSDQEVLTSMANLLFAKSQELLPSESKTVLIDKCVDKYSKDSIFLDTKISKHDLDQLKSLHKASFLSYTDIRNLLWYNGYSKSICLYDIVLIFHGKKNPGSQLFSDLITILEKSKSILEV